MLPTSPRLACAAALTLLAAACATPRQSPAMVAGADDAPLPVKPEDARTTGTLPPAPPEIIAPPVRTLSASQASSVELHVMTGEMAADRRQPELAAKEFLEALKLVDDADLAQRATLLAASAHDEDLALSAARRWLQISPNDGEPREVIARVEISRGHLKETYEQLEAIVSGAAGGPEDGFHQAAVILSMAGKEHADAAIAVMKMLVNKWPQLPAAHRSLGLLALRYNDLPLADGAAREALKLAPDSREDSLLLAGVLVRQGKVAESDAIIDKLAASDKSSADLRLGYAKLLLENDQREQARTQLQKMLQADPNNVDARYALGVLAVNDHNDADAEKFLLPLLDTARANEAAFQLGKLEENDKHYDKALGYYERVNSGASALDAAVRRAGIMGETGHMKDGRDLLAELRDQFPQLSSRLWLAEGDMLTNAGQFGEAMQVYNTALMESPDDPDLLYGRSLVYEKQGKTDLAEKDLRSLIKKDPDDARAMNALGYLLVVHTQRFDEASKLIGRALELEPDDAAILDSMGWVQYKLGHTSEAR
ncbi:MAG TPA: tetratricopeptide repeat protein, partial [Nevskiaceae bacterium]|nr:tetratricopeptide repeat protein [Nevskiaceae bacterium]